MDRGTATTSTRGLIISRTFWSCRLRTPLIISCSEWSMVPESRAPVTMRRSSESDTPEFSLAWMPKTLSVALASVDSAKPRGPTMLAMVLMGGTMSRAVERWL